MIEDVPGAEKEPRKDCPKCRDSMDEGAIAAREPNPLIPTVAPIRWFRGPIGWSWWVGYRGNERRNLDVRAWRCERCGYLELYASGPWRDADV